MTRNARIAKELKRYGVTVSDVEYISEREGEDVGLMDIVELLFDAPRGPRSVDRREEIASAVLDKVDFA